MADQPPRRHWTRSTIMFALLVLSAGAGGAFALASKADATRVERVESDVQRLKVWNAWRDAVLYGIAHKVGADVPPPPEVPRP